MPLSDLLAS